MTRIVVTSASGANGDGYGALLCFSDSGQLAGPFSEDRRITDPRGLSLSSAGDLVYVTSGDDRVLALDQNGTVVLDSGRTEGLDPGGRDVRAGRPLLYHAAASWHDPGPAAWPRYRRRYPPP
jgi:DNA-binding beta-propeller fold protein YncE